MPLSITYRMYMRLYNLYCYSIKNNILRKHQKKKSFVGARKRSNKNAFNQILQLCIPGHSFTQKIKTKIKTFFRVQLNVRIKGLVPLRTNCSISNDHISAYTRPTHSVLVSIFPISFIVPKQSA